LSYIQEKLGDLGVYEIEGKQWDSNTGLLSYSWGADKSLVNYQIEIGVREVIREIKAQKKFISQEEAIEVAHRGIEKELEKSTTFGSAIHRAIENFFEGKAIDLPTPRHQSFFDGFLYFFKQHQIEPLLIEKLLTCPHCGVATQVDWYGRIDGILTVIDWKTGRTIQPKVGLQLSCNRHVLEKNGYEVERTWANHLQPGFSYPIEFNISWSDYEIALKNYHLKRRLQNPSVFVRPIANQKKEAKNDESFKTSEDQQSAQRAKLQGHQFPQEDKDFWSKSPETICEQCLKPALFCTVRQINNSPKQLMDYLNLLFRHKSAEGGDRVKTELPILHHT